MDDPGISSDYIKRKYSNPLCLCCGWEPLLFLLVSRYFKLYPDRYSLITEMKSKQKVLETLIQNSKASGSEPKLTKRYTFKDEENNNEIENAKNDIKTKQIRSSSSLLYPSSFDTINFTIPEADSHLYGLLKEKRIHNTVIISLIDSQYIDIFLTFYYSSIVPNHISNYLPFSMDKRTYDVCVLVAYESFLVDLLPSYSDSLIEQGRNSYQWDSIGLRFLPICW